MEINDSMELYAQACNEELKTFIKELCVIPAPSHHEEKRAAYVKNWMEKNGAEDVFIDDALNVIWQYGVTDDNDLVVFMAHTDVVFPDTDPLPFTEKDGRYYCPGVGDDTAKLGVLLYAARYFVTNRIPPKTGILFVANSCEEGLGNLKGSRKIVDTYGSRIRELITVDGGLRGICNHAVGSHRWRVTIKTEGGHSFGNFGNRNAIRCMASLIEALYSVRVPQEGNSRTTYNVGTISGGTSVNTIAQEAEMLYEYRSDSAVCLVKMKDMFEKLIDAYRAMGITVETELLGERPCDGKIDPAAEEALIGRVSASIRRITGKEPILHSGSTDANYPRFKGIPSVCIGGCESVGAHTREEYLELDSLLPGTRFLLDVLSDYFEA